MTPEQTAVTDVRYKESVISFQGPSGSWIGGEQVRVEVPRSGDAADGGDLTSRGRRGDVAPAPRPSHRRSTPAGQGAPLQDRSSIPGGTKA